MNRFKETLQPVTAEKSEEIAKEMVMEVPTKKKQLDLSRFDWTRTGYANPRDPRCLGGQCRGNHEVETFGRGSSSGQNGHALWLSCRDCKLRVLYVPRWGATGSYRSAGPLPQDVEDKLKRTDPNDLHPAEMKTKALGLEAAEQSALKQLEMIKQKKAVLAKGKSKGKPEGTTATSSTEKMVKRDHDVPAELQEDWTKVDAVPATIEVDK